MIISSVFSGKWVSEMYSHWFRKWFEISFKNELLNWFFINKGEEIKENDEVTHVYMGGGFVNVLKGAMKYKVKVLSKNYIWHMAFVCFEFIILRVKSTFKS
jgi:hypothetical protein